MPVPRETTSRRAFLAGAGGLAAATFVAAGCTSDGGPKPDAAASGPTTVRYGSHPRQVADLWLPAPPRAAGGSTTTAGGSTTAPAPIPRRGAVVLVHGGWWRPQFHRDLMEPLARSVVKQGWVAWNLEYRAVGEGGGWPTTFADLAAGVDRLSDVANRARVSLGRVAVVGHSAGGTLALWSAARSRLLAGVTGADPRLKPAAVVSLAGVNNLASAAFERLGGGAVSELMGGPADGAGGGDYTWADPAERLPLHVPQLLVHGEADDVVPVHQTQAYALKAVAAGDRADVLITPGAGHFDVIDPAQKPWHQVLDWLGEFLGA